MALTTLPAGEKKPAQTGDKKPAQKGEKKGQPKQKFFFKDGDTIVVMGDSITEQHLYSNYLEMWSVSRFPAWQLTFRNVGIGGDRSVGGNSRFQRDVVAHKPTVLTVDFGMNDGGYRPVDPKLLEAYMKGLQGIADQAKAANIRVAWITPQPVEHNPGNKGETYNKTLERFSEGVKENAEKNGGLFVDQFHPYWAVIQKAREGGEKGRITSGDAVHPGPPGQALMAASILKGLKFPSEVSSVALDLEEPWPKSRTAKKCKVVDLQVTREKGGAAVSVKFYRQDNALPFFPAQAKSILKYAPLLEEMNNYGLKVTGLKAGNYEIRIGGTKIAQRTAEQLAGGVNLASEVLAAGPIADQVNKVWKAVQDKNRYFHDKIFRGVVLARITDMEERKKLYTERMEKMPALDDAVRDALVMRPYQVEIVPAAAAEEKKSSSAQ
jgi:lysophospholipase L1-like esterase